MREACQSPFFKAIQSRQPFSPNFLLPCQLIDNPQVFRDIYAKYHPYPTHTGAESLVNELAPVLDHYSFCVQKIMEPAWENGPHKTKPVEQQKTLEDKETILA